ncbi:MAG TPA: hypothetical protein VKQ36_15790 [Ktedonobacterales bacterium]|nr:hypothetical protein [Ktedonobacterales bacterium]
MNRFSLPNSATCVALFLLWQIERARRIGERYAIVCLALAIVVLGMASGVAEHAASQPHHPTTGQHTVVIYITPTATAMPGQWKQVFHTSGSWGLVTTQAFTVSGIWRITLGAQCQGTYGMPATDDDSYGVSATIVPASTATLAPGQETVSDYGACRSHEVSAYEQGEGAFVVEVSSSDSWWLTVSQEVSA